LWDYPFLIITVFNVPALYSINRETRVVLAEEMAAAVLSKHSAALGEQTSGSYLADPIGREAARF